ncbi:MAG: efflux RND transporter periplasmic adaptor subunit [Betaproteobacteria bacterium]
MPLPSFRRRRIDPSAVRAALASPWVKRGLLVLAAVVAAGYFFRDTIVGTPVEVHEVTRGDLVQTVVASGRVTTPQRVSVGAVVTERVVRIPVDEGKSVRRGDVLIALDDRDERAAVTQAEATIAQAEARIRQLRELGLPAAEQAVLQAEANLRLARQQYQRNVELKDKGFISQSALDDAKRNLDVADSQLRAARLQVQTNSPAGGDFRMAQTALDQARAAMRAANAKLEQTVIRAPTDGVLIGRNVEPGDVVQPGKELMVLAPAGETHIVVQIDEKNLAQLKLGQKALGSADAYPRERFPAELFYINPGIDALRGSVEVKLRVTDPPAYLRQDMTVSVDIEIARRSGTLVAPADTVFDAAGAHPWVLAVDGHRATRKPVTLGLKGEGRVEIVAGVGPGDRLIPAAAAVVPGQRIRIVAAAGPVDRP